MARCNFKTYLGTSLTGAHLQCYVLLLIKAITIYCTTFWLWCMCLIHTYEIVSWWIYLALYICYPVLICWYSVLIQWQNNLWQIVKYSLNIRQSLIFFLCGDHVSVQIQKRPKLHMDMSVDVSHIWFLC